MARAEFHLHENAVIRVVSSTTDDLAKKGAEAVQARARRLAPRRTGRLAESIRVRKVTGGVRTTYEVGSGLNYARYQEFGTGPIFPRKPGGVLAWRGDTGAMVFARYTRGVPATHFMLKAAQMSTVADFVGP